MATSWDVLLGLAAFEPAFWWRRYVGMPPVILELL